MEQETARTVRTTAGREGLVTPREAGRVGVSADDLRAACASGELVRVRVGAYAEGEQWRRLDAAGRYRLRVLAAARRLRRPLFTHDSAAALWRLPRIGPWPEDVHVAVPHVSGSASAGGVQRHRLAVLPDHLVRVDGVRATGVTRTVVDVARSWSFTAALVAADHALHARWATPARLEAELARTGSGRGVRRARAVLAAASGQSESVGESLSRARMVELGLPVPQLQHVVEDADGVVGRVDFWWPELGVVGEFDGRLKYRAGGVVDGRAVEERVWQEKQREDRLRAVGLRVVRWTWDTALDPDRLARALGAAGIRP